MDGSYFEELIAFLVARVGFKFASGHLDDEGSSVASCPPPPCHVTAASSRQFIPSLAGQVGTFEWDLPLFSIQNYESSPVTHVDGGCAFLGGGPLVTIRLIGKNLQQISLLCEDCPALFRLLRFINDKTFASEPRHAFAFAYGEKRLATPASTPPKLPPRKGSVPISPLKTAAGSETEGSLGANMSALPLPVRLRSAWDLYNPLKEYRRLGFIQDIDPNERLSGPVGWRLVNQIMEGRSKFWVCKTYPSVFVVPACVTDAQMLEVRKFRSENRIPVAVWKHPTNHATLSRSSQPLVGMKKNRNTEDEKLVQVFCYYLLINSFSKSVPISYLQEPAPAWPWEKNSSSTLSMLEVSSQ